MLTPGSVLDGRYEILRPLKTGGMGEVYLARRALLGDDVAIKVMHPSFGEAAAPRQRFLRESRSCAQLHHPNIVTILDFNVSADGQPYLVMELLSGPSLREEIDAEAPMTVSRVLEIVGPIASALQLAHDRGVVHRDLKPENIVVHRYESGERLYKVIDFGLAAVKQALDETRLTASHVFMGTVGYASPEQLRGESADARSDIYSFGVIVYELLTGRRPFEHESDMTVVLRELDEHPPEPARDHPGLPAAMDAVILQALAKIPGDRWPRVQDFARALRVAGGGATAATAVAADDMLLARYELGPLLGQGRLGSAVYRATHRALGIPLAIRILRREEQPNWEAVRERFLIEARTLQVPHGNLLQVRDFGGDGRRVFVVTDLIAGPSLREEMATAVPLPWPRVVALLRQMLDATMVLNAHGGFIAGVNPDMIRLTRESGVERVVMSTAGIRSVQDVLATMREQELRGQEANERELPYFAPEVLLGRAPAPAADVFTLGVLAYEMATGTLPYRAPTLPELIGRMLQTTPRLAHEVNQDIPATASALLAGCLADVDTRPSARDVLAALNG